MNSRLIMISSALLFSVPAFGEAPATQAVAESALPHSSVSVLVEPALSDGRLVIRIAAQNRTTAPVAFGPGTVTLAKAAGEPIALRPLQRLVDDVRIAAGMPVEAAAGGAPTAGAYASPQMMSDTSGRVDVSGYTGGTALAGDEIIRRSNQRRSEAKPTISAQEAESQIAALKQVILQDSTVQPKQVAAAQVVSEKLKFKKGEDRTVHLWVRFAGDEHSFTLAAPEK